MKRAIEWVRLLLTLRRIARNLDADRMLALVEHAARLRAGQNFETARHAERKAGA